MKVTIQVPKEIEVTHILIDVPVEYGDEDIPYDFPLRVKGPQLDRTTALGKRLGDDRWVAEVNIDTGKIAGWPADAGPRELYMKVNDAGIYTLRTITKDGDSPSVIGSVKREHEYVPHGVVPGEDGDYIILRIAADGTITNWPKKPDLSAFFGGDDED